MSSQTSYRPEWANCRSFRSNRRKPRANTGEFATFAEHYKLTSRALKPVTFERFLKAVNKARLQIDLNRQAAQVDLLPAEYLFVKADNKLNKIEFKDILYVEAIGDYIKIFSTNTTVTSKSSLKLMEEKLPSERFIRIHHPFLISLTSVKAVKKGFVELSNGKNLPVAKTRKDALYQALQISEE